MNDKRRYKPVDLPERDRNTESDATGNAAADGYTLKRREQLDPPTYGGRESSGPVESLEDEFGQRDW